MKLLKSIVEQSGKLLNHSAKFTFKCLKMVGGVFLCIYVVSTCLIGSFCILFPHSCDEYMECNTCKTHELKLQGLKYELIETVDSYIQYVAPGSCLNGIVLVESCELYGVDLKFALAQGHIESHFGTKGIASKTNSVFNVGSWDGLSAKQINKSGKGYSHPDKSVIPYLAKLKNDYLVGKSEKDLFKKFVNVRGERYASNPNYEHQLKRIYDNIDSIYNISDIYNRYKQYKEFLSK